MIDFCMLIALVSLEPSAMIELYPVVSVHSDPVLALASLGEG